MSELESNRGRTRDAEKTREVILNAAEAVFAEHGFGRARIDAIAQVADYNKSLIGQYFGDKLGLYVEVLKRADSELDALLAHGLAPLLADGTFSFHAHGFRTFLETLVQTMFDYLIEHPRFLRLLTWEMAEGWQTYAQIVSQLSSGNADQSETLFAKAWSAGLLRSDFSPMIQLTLVYQICQSYLAFLPLYQILLPGEDVSSARMLARGRDYIVALIVQGMMVDPKDGEAGEFRVNRPEARNDDTK